MKLNFSKLEKYKYLFPLILGGMFFIGQIAWALQTSTQVVSTVQINVCGNLVAELPAEQCDNLDFAGQTCSDFGYNTGSLSCNPDCTIDSSDCSTESGGGGGGGGGATPPPQQDTNTVNFSGRAYPNSDIFLLKDAQIVATSIAGPDSRFSFSLSGISAGNYIFSLYSEDSSAIRSSLYTFSVYVSQSMTTNVSGIYIAPTIAVDKSQVKRGDNIAIFGQSVPDSEVTIGVASDLEQYVKTDADEDGIYLYNFNTVDLEMGEHLTKSRSSYNGDVSPYSQAISFLVGDKNVMRDDDTCGAGTGDLNCDIKVNLVDFSIMAYWYQRSGVPDNVDLNNDNKVDLVDFSILAYYWTG